MRFNLLFISLFLCISLSAQKGDNYKILETYVETYTTAVKKGDLTKITALTHPAIIEMGGGQEFMLNELSAEHEMYNSLNLRLLNITTKSTSKIIDAGDELHAVVPYVIDYQNGEEQYKEENFYLAASLDSGVTWYFVDYKKYDAESIKLFLPNYNERLNIFLSSTQH